MPIIETGYKGALAQWFQSFASANTRRSYELAVLDFEAFAGIEAIEADSSHVIAWQNAMRQAGKAASTINNRLSALSSLFEFLKRFPVGGKYLVSGNPVDHVSRARVNQYENSDALAADEVRALLGRIDRSTPGGARDFALLATSVYLGVRVSELVGIRWGDIVHSDGKIFYRWAGKGGKSATDELPQPCYDAIVAYLEAAGRMDGMGEDDYVFVALSDVAARLPNVRSNSGHLTPAMVGRILKKCARRAGLDPRRVRPHMLRHTAADLMLEASNGDVRAVQRFLHHSTLATTDIYFSRRARNVNPHWIRVQELIGC